MLDVHPPYHTPNTWRDFLFHIATIVVGLLIAVGLEQTVEAIRHHREGSELRERLRAESEQILSDSRRAEVAQRYQLAWLAARLAQVRAAAWEGQPLPQETPDDRPYFASPDIPQWRTAHDSGLTTRLTAAEVTGFAEVEYVQTRVQALDLLRVKAEGELGTFDRELPRLPDGEPDFHKVRPQDVEVYLRLLSAETDAVTNYLIWIRVAIGAESALINGKFILNDIYASERDAAHNSVNINPHRN